MTDLSEEDKALLELFSPFEEQMDAVQETADEEATDIVVAIALEDREVQIRNEFPALNILETVDLLPDGLGEELTGDLRKMVTLLPGLEGPEWNRAAMLEAYNDGDLARYNHLYGELIHADAKP